jgi:hypothetical protein
MGPVGQDLWNATVPFAINTNLVYSFEFSVPISGWAATDIVTPESSISGQARYTTNAAQSIAGAGSSVVVDFEDKVYDINNEVTAGAGWLFTAKTAGYYQVNARVTYASSSAWGAGEYAVLELRKNSTTVALATNKVIDATVTQEYAVSVSDAVYLNPGDTLDVRTAQTSGSTIALVNVGSYNYISISKVTGPGSQSFYISSPLVAPPDGTGIKLKSSTNTDVMTVSDTGSAVITATSGVGLIVKGSGTTSASSNQIWRASDNTTLGYVENGGAWTMLGNVTSTGGNFVVGTAGKGIDFTATASIGTPSSELLNDYEEGTYTPTVYGTFSLGNGTLTARYVKVGVKIYVSIRIVWGTTTTTTGLAITGIDLPTSATYDSSGTFYVRDSGSGGVYGGLAFIRTNADPAKLGLRTFANADIAPTVPITFSDGDELSISITYID